MLKKCFRTLLECKKDNDSVFLLSLRFKNFLFPKYNKHNCVIVLQGSLEVNTSVLIGSCFVGVCLTPKFAISIVSIISRAFFSFRKPVNSRPECHAITCLVTWPVQTLLGNVGPRSFLYGPSLIGALGLYCHDLAQCSPMRPYIKLLIITRHVT